MFIDYNTKLLGIIGSNISYTLSPAIHNFSFEKMGINSVYLVFDIKQDRFDKVIDGLLEIGEGFNVTIPYKERIIPHIEKIDESAEKIGAVNTIHKGIGYNTDYIALKNLVTERISDKNSFSSLIFGAGGAARAAAFALASLDSEILIINRTVERANKLAYALKQYGYNAKVVSSCSEINYDVIVNSTPDPSSVEKNCIKGKLAIEFVYHPLRTSFLEIALSKNMKVINGLEILIAQALEAQKIWFGRSLSYKEVEDYLYARKLIR